MHGAVNQAIEDLVIKEFGIAAWKQVKEKSGFKDEIFLSNQPYPDDLTFKLVVAAHEVSGLPVDTLLFAFGEHWILETGLKKYGAVLQAGGSDYMDFMIKLPEFHGRVMMLYPNIIPPEFEVIEKNGKLIVDYHSIRDGLNSFVQGLLSGIAKMFKQDIEIKVLAHKSEGAANDQFEIELI